jgi:hypothetical protein
MNQHQINWLDIRLTTHSGRKQLLDTESTIIDALVTRQAIVVAFMKTALYTKQVTGSALQPAELDACQEVYYPAVECSAEIFDACVLSLETLYV